MRLFQILILLVILVSCETNDPILIEQHPYGYQPDIEWPSLADSPWPMYRGNPQGTCRSKCVGPQQGIVEWERDSLSLTSGLSVGYSNTLYTISEAGIKGVVAINENGQFDWKFEDLGEYAYDLHTVPIILADSSIICTNGGGQRLFKISYQGKLQWVYRAFCSLFNTGITVDKIGNIYLFDQNDTLHAVNQTGELLWKVHDERFFHGGNQALTMSPDGKIIYAQGSGVAVVAFDIKSKSIKWTFENAYSQCHPMVDAQGNIYTILQDDENNSGYYLYSLYPDGTIRWKYYYEIITRNKTEPAICMDKMGNTIFGYDTLYSINYTGELNWKTPLSHRLYIIPQVDIEGNIYIVLSINNQAILPVCYDKDGNLLWELERTISSDWGICGAMTEGTLYTSFWQYGGVIAKIK